jgi:hypothetical protein
MGVGWNRIQEELLPVLAKGNSRPRNIRDERPFISRPGYYRSDAHECTLQLKVKSLV